MYIVKTKGNGDDIYRAFYSQPINPYFISYNFYKDGHLYMDEEHFIEYQYERQDPELIGIDSGLGVIEDWGDISSGNEFEFLSEFIIDCLLQGEKIEYDKPLFVNIKR